MNDMTDMIGRISGVNPRKCMRCGKCSASCPAYDEMDYHPHQFVSMVESGRIDELARSRGIYTCLSCFACVERCPRSVEPAKLIERETCRRVDETLLHRIERYGVSPERHAVEHRDDRRRRRHTDASGVESRRHARMPGGLLLARQRHARGRRLADLHESESLAHA